MTYDVYDYLNFRGDLAIDVDGLSPVDASIFARLSYLPVELVKDVSTEFSIEKLGKLLFKRDDLEKYLIMSEDKILLQEVIKTERFKNIKITNFESETDEEIQKQFAAVTFILPDSVALVTFRGTGRELVGWEEDFNMSFLNSVPSQIQALNYLEKISKVFDKIILNGHSKGGNLSLYSLTKCDKEVYNKIIKAFNFDGPGLTEESLTEESRNRANEKMTNYIPQCSIVGTLLEREGNVKIVSSKEEFIKQHDMFQWQISGRDFVYLDVLSKESKFVEFTLKQWISKISNENRELFFESVYDLFNQIGKTEFDLIINNREFIKTLGKLTLSLKDLPSDHRKIVIDKVTELLKIASKNYIEMRNEK